MSNYTMADRRICMTLDLEPDHAGVVDTERYDAWNEKTVDTLVSLLQKYGAPLSIFVVGQSLHKQPTCIQKLIAYDSEFHLHSYSHNCTHPQAQYEIEKGRKAFKEYFGQDPQGYRTPMGKIEVSDYEILKKEGFLFSSSIHPSIWPHPKYLQYPDHPYFDPLSGMLEIPVTTHPLLRLPVSLGWMKMIGWVPYQHFFHQTTHSPFIFNMHLHDLYQATVFEMLPRLWKLAYSRNRLYGFDYLERSLYTLSERGYLFTTVSKVAHSCAQHL